VNGSVLTVGDFIEAARSLFSKAPEDVLNNCIDRKVIDHEALGRHYETGPDLKKMVRRYEDQLLKSTFIKRIIMPQVVVTDEMLKKYYSKKQSSFLKPVRFKIQQITVKSRDEAREILNNLQGGADFAWVARKKSIDAAAPKGGEAGWFKKEELPKSFAEIIDTLNTGNLSAVMKLDSSYGIFRVQERTTEEPEAFDKVKEGVFRACVSEQVNNLLDKYVSQLKTGARIKVYNQEIRKIEEKFKR